MFFFGIASHLITLVVLSIFSLFFFYQGIHDRVFGNNEEQTIGFSENNTTNVSINFEDAVNMVAVTSAEQIELPSPPFIRLHSFLIYPKIFKEVRFILPDRGPPTV